MIYLFLLQMFIAFIDQKCKTAEPLLVSVVTWYSRNLPDHIPSQLDHFPRGAVVSGWLQNSHVTKSWPRWLSVGGEGSLHVTATELDGSWHSPFYSWTYRTEWRSSTEATEIYLILIII